MILMKILWLIDSSFFEVKTAKMQLNSCWTMEQMQIPNITLETTRKCLLTTFFINDFKIAICDFEQLEIQYSLKKIFKLLETKSIKIPCTLLFCSSLHYAASLSGEADILELLLRYDANVDALNDDGETPLFFATKSNNKFAASTLIDRKANYRHKNNMGRWYWDHWWGANWQNIAFLYIYLYKVLRQKHVLYVIVICIFHSH